MRFVLTLFLIFFALAAIGGAHASEQKVSIAPGLWQTSSRVGSIDFPDGTPGQKHTMNALMGGMVGQVTSWKTCVPALNKQPPAVLFVGPAGSGCVVRSISILSGKISLVLKCPKPESTSQSETTYRGDAAANFFRFDSHSVSASLTGMAGKMQMVVTSAVSGRRISACQAK